MAEAKPQPSLLITLAGKAEATLTKAADLFPAPPPFGVDFVELWAIANDEEKDEQ